VTLSPVPPHPHRATTAGVHQGAGAATPGADQDGRGGVRGGVGRAQRRQPHARGRGLHSLASELNLSAVYGVEGARRGCVARVKGVLEGAQGV